MKNTWILDVLSDLKAFAQHNGMAHLAEQLDTTRLVAATEIATAEGGAPEPVHLDDAKHRAYPGKSGAVYRA